MVPKVGYHNYTDDTGVEVSQTGRDQVELAGRAVSRDGRTRRRAQPHDSSARRRVMKGFFLDSLSSKSISGAVLVA